MCWCESTSARLPWRSGLCDCRPPSARRPSPAVPRSLPSQHATGYLRAANGVARTMGTPRLACPQRHAVRPIARDAIATDAMWCANSGRHVCSSNDHHDVDLRLLIGAVRLPRDLCARRPWRRIASQGGADHLTHRRADRGAHARAHAVAHWHHATAQPHGMASADVMVSGALSF
jgi:hypothetical protein